MKRADRFIHTIKSKCTGIYNMAWISEKIINKIQVFFNHSIDTSTHHDTDLNLDLRRRSPDEAVLVLI